MMFLFEVGLVGGLIAVAFNPSPFFGALGLVAAAGMGCLILMMSGVTFLSLVLFLIYLGGMMVVFAYSAALVAEPYPEAWGGKLVLMCLACYSVFMGMVWFGCELDKGVKFLLGCREVVDWFGVSELFGLGGWVLMAGGWTLLLTLFVVLEVVWGRYNSVLRNV